MKTEIKTTLLIHPEELDKVWIDRLVSLGYTTLSLHPRGGRKANETLAEMLEKLKDDEYKSLIDYAISKGLKIEYEFHCMGYLLPRNLYSDHPEYFREDSQGNRVSDYNLCVSNKEALEIVGQNALKLAKSLYKSEHNYYFWADDIKEESTCMCVKCRKLSASDKNLIVMNSVITALRKEIPDAKLAYLAYQGTLTPPEISKPNEGIFLEYAPIDRKFDKTYSEQGEENIENIKKLIDFFGKKDSKVLEYWTDNSMFSNWQKPVKEYFPSYEVIEKDINMYADMGFETISAFACFLGSDYIELYGEPDVPGFRKLIRNN